ncbi:MAG: DNA-binding protein [Chlamydiia bacterium]|nr:DNA-binding protein [Chlamydiia bacterium]
MRFVNYSKGFVLKLEPGEEFQETLREFVIKKRIPSAFFQGIGALSEIELGFFSLEKNDYERHSFGGHYELINANGNISDEMEGPFVHTHVTLSDEKCRPIAGHLFKGIVSVTAEIFLFPMDIALLRRPDPKLNFKGLELPHLFVRD